MRGLFEILDSGSEDGLYLISVDVFIDAVSISFGMSHFTENSAVGGGNTLDSTNGVVGIVARIESGLT